MPVYQYYIHINIQRAALGGLSGLDSLDVRNISVINTLNFILRNQSEKIFAQWYDALSCLNSSQNNPRKNVFTPIHHLSVVWLDWFIHCWCQLLHASRKFKIHISVFQFSAVQFCWPLQLIFYAVCWLQNCCFCSSALICWISYPTSPSRKQPFLQYSEQTVGTTMLLFVFLKQCSHS